MSACLALGAREPTPPPRPFPTAGDPLPVDIKDHAIETVRKAINICADEVVLKPPNCPQRLDWQGPPKATDVEWLVFGTPHEAVRIVFNVAEHSIDVLRHCRHDGQISR